MAITYKDAGVDIDKTNAALNLSKSPIQSTFTPGVLSAFGGFGGCFDINQMTQGLEAPVIIQSVDGVGSKTKLASELNQYHHLGQDLLSACANDIAVMGAQPITFLDYIASASLNTEVFHSIIESLVSACKEHDIALIGGETAEMPTVYRANTLDLVGVITGVVEKRRIIDGSMIRTGDQVYGIASSGLHTNGYTLARTILADEDLSEKPVPNEASSLGELLLTPHINYTPMINALLKKEPAIHGMAHITGGGLADNIKRILPQTLNAVIAANSWTVPSIFKYLQAKGNLSLKESLKTFNMGIGLVIVGPASLGETINALKDTPACFHIGEIAEGNGTVQFF